ncbi:hypothetical protein D9758_011855 [Tetrapyrgos nigripes]|uniref:Uncharacterized protein n=1 Tax=Tetrapyrgos nigripes TaxID=182062 RepID=A0A8H5FP28_9AGAR|nr:hypothetical protein D9758_011855 [Tetrapyrgos nigripes]
MQVTVERDHHHDAPSSPRTLTSPSRVMKLVMIQLEGYVHEPDLRVQRQMRSRISFDPEESEPPTKKRRTNRKKNPNTSKSNHRPNQDQKTRQNEPTQSRKRVSAAPTFSVQNYPSPMPTTLPPSFTYPTLPPAPLDYFKYNSQNILLDTSASAATSSDEPVQVQIPQSNVDSFFSNLSSITQDSLTDTLFGAENHDLSWLDANGLDNNPTSSVTFTPRTIYQLLPPTSPSAAMSDSNAARNGSNAGSNSPEVKENPDGTSIGTNSDPHPLSSIADLFGDILNPSESSTSASTSASASAVSAFIASNVPVLPDSPDCDFLNLDLFTACNDVNGPSDLNETKDHTLVNDNNNSGYDTELELSYQSPESTSTSLSSLSPSDWDSTLLYLADCISAASAATSGTVNTTDTTATLENLELELDLVEPDVDVDVDVIAGSGGFQFGLSYLRSETASWSGSD